MPYSLVSQDHPYVNLPYVNLPYVNLLILEDLKFMIPFPTAKSKSLPNFLAIQCVNMNIIYTYLYDISDSLQGFDQLRETVFDDLKVLTEVLFVSRYYPIDRDALRLCRQQLLYLIPKQRQWLQRNFSPDTFTTKLE